MIEVKVNNKKRRELMIDYIITSAVFLQPILILLQQVMIYVFYMPAEDTTSYRVLFTAVPMSVAILLSIFRKPRLFLISYSVALLLIFLTTIFFPANNEYLFSNSIRFLLPVVLPSALCLMSIRNYEIVERIMYYCSIVVAFEVLFIAYFFFMGVVSIDRYNMTFSYGCLMPMIVLFSKKKFVSMALSLSLFIVVLGIGSRGANVFFVIFVIGNLLMNDKKKMIWIILLVIIFIFLLPYLADIFESYGISSKTLRRLDEGTLSESNARDYIWDFYLNMLLEHPMGIGLYGDRVYLDSAYCHNILLEILLNFGIFGGSFILLFLSFYCIRLFNLSTRLQQNKIWLYLMAFVAPLMLSESYIQSNTFFVAVGLMYVLEQERRSPWQTYSTEGIV